MLFPTHEKKAEAWAARVAARERAGQLGGRARQFAAPERKQRRAR